MGPERKICIVPYGTETTKAVLEGLTLNIGIASISRY